MAEVTKETIQNLSELSRIGCPEAEQESFLKDLNQILAYVDQLQELDTEGVSPCNHVIEGMANVMRDDVVGEILSRKKFLENCSEQTSGLVRIPSIFSKR